MRGGFGGRSLMCQECGAEISLAHLEPISVEAFEVEERVKSAASPGNNPLEQALSLVASSGGRGGVPRGPGQPSFVPVSSATPSTAPSTLVWWIIGAGAVGVFLLLVGAGIVIGIAHSARQPQMARRNVPQPQPAGAARPHDGQASPPDGAPQGKIDPVKAEAPEGTERKGGKQIVPMARSESSGRAPANWRVEVDGLNEWIPIPFDHKVEVKVPRNSGADILFPEVPSLFVAVGSNHSERDQREIWNLQSNQRLGAIKGVRIPSLKTALSANGNYFAALPLGATAVIALWDVQAGKALPDLRFNPDGFVRAVAFAGSDRLIAVSGKNECSVWSIPSGKPERVIELSRYLEVDSLALSPGGRYLTYVDGEPRRRRVCSYDLTTGEQAGELSFEVRDHGAQTCKALQFSPDGKEFAGIFDNGTKSVLLCWEIATGKLRTDFEFEERTGAIGMRQYSRLQWFPDRARWLLNGHFVLDRASGKIIASIGTDQLGQLEPCYVLDDRRVLQVLNDRGDRTLVSVVLPEDALGSKSAKPVVPTPTLEGPGAGTD